MSANLVSLWNISSPTVFASIPMITSRVVLYYGPGLVSGSSPGLLGIIVVFSVMLSWLSEEAGKVCFYSTIITFLP